MQLTGQALPSLFSLQVGLESGCGGEPFSDTKMEPTP